MQIGQLKKRADREWELLSHYRLTLPEFEAYSGDEYADVRAIEQKRVKRLLPRRRP